MECVWVGIANRDLHFLFDIYYDCFISFNIYIVNYFNGENRIQYIEWIFIEKINKLNNNNQWFVLLCYLVCVMDNPIIRFDQQ
jgi:hypothetical protein